MRISLRCQSYKWYNHSAPQKAIILQHHTTQHTTPRHALLAFAAQIQAVVESRAPARLAESGSRQVVFFKECAVRILLNCQTMLNHYNMRVFPAAPEQRARPKRSSWDDVFTSNIFKLCVFTSYIVLHLHTLHSLSLALALSLSLSLSLPNNTCACLFVGLRVCLSVCLYVCLRVALSSQICIYLPTKLSIYWVYSWLSACLSTCLSVYLRVCILYMYVWLCMCVCMQCNAMQCNALRFIAMQCNAPHCVALQCNVRQRNAM